MKNLRQKIMGLGFVTASSFLTTNAAHALSGPSTIQIDGGPLGVLDLSGGMDSYGYVVSGLGNGQQNTGINVGSALIELQKTTGELQFTLAVGSSGGAIAPGTITARPSQTTIGSFSTGPLFAGYMTLAPKDMPFTLSAGRFTSIEGYEYGLPAWFDSSQLVTDIYWVQNGQDTGVEGSYNQGPLAVTINFGDGWDTHVFNFLQALTSYSFNTDNVLSLYYGGNLGRTGLNARTYGWSGGTTVSDYGPYFMNSQLFGAYYSYTTGDLNLVPEVQYVFAKTDHQLGIDKTTSNLGVALFADYSLAKTPYSLGGWIEYENSRGAGAWFLGPQSQGVGFALSPTWQYKSLFVRANAGGFYLTQNKSDGVAYGYGGNSEGKFQFAGTLEVGLML